MLQALHTNASLLLSNRFKGVKLIGLHKNITANIDVGLRFCQKDRYIGFQIFFDWPIYVYIYCIFDILLCLVIL